MRYDNLIEHTITSANDVHNISWKWIKRKNDYKLAQIYANNSIILASLEIFGMNVGWKFNDDDIKPVKNSGFMKLLTPIFKEIVQDHLSSTPIPRGLIVWGSPKYRADYYRNIWSTWAPNDHFKIGTFGSESNGGVAFINKDYLDEILKDKFPYEKLHWIT